MVSLVMTILAWILIVLGGAVALSGLGSISRRSRSWPEWALLYLAVFRRVVVGLCVVGAGVGLMWHVDWLLAVSVCVGIGEWLESSYYIGVMRSPAAQSILSVRTASRAKSSSAMNSSGIGRRNSPSLIPWNTLGTGSVPREGESPSSA